jgi:hypothetical protein
VGPVALAVGADHDFAVTLGVPQLRAEVESAER